MRAYELMYILDPTLDEDATQGLISQIEDFVVKQEVTIEDTDPWGKRRLAYQIGRHWEGYYVLCQLKAGPQSLSEVERRLRVTDGVLRFITVRLDKEQAKLEPRRRQRTAQETPAEESPEGPAPTEAVDVDESEEAAATPETEESTVGRDVPAEEPEQASQDESAAGPPREEK